MRTLNSMPLEYSNVRPIALAVRIECATCGHRHWKS